MMAVIFQSWNQHYFVIMVPFLCNYFMAKYVLIGGRELHFMIPEPSMLQFTRSYVKLWRNSYRLHWNEL